MSEDRRKPPERYLVPLLAASAGGPLYLMVATVGESEGYGHPQEAQAVAACWAHRDRERAIGAREALKKARDAECGPCSVGTGIVVDATDLHVGDIRKGLPMEKCKASNIRKMLAATTPTEGGTDG